jgi:hypothetical protein
MTPPMRQDIRRLFPLTQMRFPSTLRQRKCQHHLRSENAFYHARRALEGVGVGVGVDVLAEEGRVGQGHPLSTRQRVNETGSVDSPSACEDTGSTAVQGAFDA